MTSSLSVVPPGRAGVGRVYGGGLSGLGLGFTLGSDGRTHSDSTLSIVSVIQMSTYRCGPCSVMRGGRLFLGLSRSISTCVVELRTVQYCMEDW